MKTVNPGFPLFFLWLFAFLLPESAFCLTRSEAVELSKSRILSLAPHFASLAYTCFVYEKDCQIEGNAQEATIKWLSDEQTRHDPKILFDSGSEKFLIDGAVRIAKTGNRWGSPVIFNEDLLARELSPGQFRALDLFEILAVLIHEFGHHQDQMLRSMGMPPLPHHELDLIGVRVVSYLKDRTRLVRLGAETIPGLPAEDGVTFFIFEIESNNGIRNVWSKVFVDSRWETREISSSLVTSLECPVERTNGHITFKGKAHYAAFRRVRAPVIEASGPSVIFAQEVGGASALCVDETMGTYQVFDGFEAGALRLALARNEQGRYLFDPARSSFRATRRER